MSHRAIYLIVGGIFAVLLVVMLVTFNYNRSNQEAVAKAEQLTAALDRRGSVPADPRPVAKVSAPTAGRSAPRPGRSPRASQS